MIFQTSNINVSLNPAPVVNYIDLGTKTIPRTGSYKASLSNYIGYSDFMAAFGEIDNTTVGVGVSIFDRQFEVVFTVNAVEVGSIVIDSIGAWQKNPLYFTANKFESITAFVRYYRVDSEVDLSIETLVVNVDEVLLGYEVIQPQPLNLEQGCYCDKIGIGETFSAQLRTLQRFTKGNNLIQNSSFSSVDGFSNWISDPVNEYGLDMSNPRRMTLLNHTFTNPICYQILALTQGTHFVSFNFWMDNLNFIPSSTLIVRFFVYDLTGSQIVANYLVDNDTVLNDGTYKNFNFNFDAPTAGNYRVYVQINHTNISNIEFNIGFDDIYIHKVTKTTTPTIDKIEIVGCDGIPEELDCETIIDEGGSYSDDYSDDYDIEEGYPVEDCTIKVIEYVELEDKYTQAIITILNPIEGEFKYIITDSEGNEFTTPIFYIPLVCDELLKISNYNDNSFIISSETQVNEYYLRGFVGTIKPIDSERISHEQSDGSVEMSYYRGHKESLMTIGVYSGDLHVFIDRYLSLGNLEINDKEYVIGAAARYEILDLNNGMATAQIDVKRKNQGFVSVN